MSPLDTVTFDLWQTLIVDSMELGAPRMQARLDGVAAALAGEGFDFPYDHLRKATRTTYEILDEVRTNEGDVTFTEQVGIFLKAVDEELAARLSPEARAEVERHYADSYLDHPPQVDPEAADVLAATREMGLKVALICNTGATPGVTQRTFLDRAGLIGYFDTLTFSDEERLSKPAKAIFDRTLERIGSKAEGAIHVGDHHRNDVEGAKRAGLRAIWLRRNDSQPAIPPDAEIVSLGQAVPIIHGLAEALP